MNLDALLNVACFVLPALAWGAVCWIGLSFDKRQRSLFAVLLAALGFLVCYFVAQPFTHWPNDLPPFVMWAVSAVAGTWSALSHMTNARRRVAISGAYAGVCFLPFVVCVVRSDSALIDAWVGIQLLGIVLPLGVAVGAFIAPHIMRTWFGWREADVEICRDDARKTRLRLLVSIMVVLLLGITMGNIETNVTATPFLIYFLLFVVFSAIFTATILGTVCLGFFGSRRIMVVACAACVVFGQVGLYLDAMYFNYRAFDSFYDLFPSKEAFRIFLVMVNSGFFVALLLRQNGYRIRGYSFTDFA